MFELDGYMMQSVISACAGLGSVFGDVGLLTNFLLGTHLILKQKKYIRFWIYYVRKMTDLQNNFWKIWLFEKMAIWEKITVENCALEKWQI
jgi:hypothetical protein